VASLHGAALVTEGSDSPHWLLAQTKASFLFAIARNDDARAPGDKAALKAAAQAAGRQAEVEVYPADHGWTVPDAPVYNHAEAERAWSRMLALFAAL
jgi:carboxymethylenebutenolidase